MNTNDKLLKGQEVAKMLNVTYMTVLRMGVSGKLTRIELSKRCTRFKYSEVMRLINNDSEELS